MLSATLKGRDCHPTFHVRELRFSQLPEVTQLKAMGPESQEIPLLLPSCLPFIFFKGMPFFFCFVWQMICLQCRRPEFNSWVGKIPLEKEMATLSSPGESHGQRSLAGYNPWGRKESYMTE